MCLLELDYDKEHHLKMKTEKNYMKRTMYANVISKRNKAYNSGFYYEAVMLDYAVVEDRLNTFLWNLGIVKVDENGPTVTRRTKKPMRELLGLSDNSKFMIKNMDTKLCVIKAILSYNGEDELLLDMKHCLINRVGADTILELIERIAKWKEKRNQIVHGLMNRVPRECDEAVIQIVAEGKKIFRELDNYCGRIEKCAIRAKYRIQN